MKWQQAKVFHECHHVYDAVQSVQGSATFSQKSAGNYEQLCRTPLLRSAILKVECDCVSLDGLVQQRAAHADNFVVGRMQQR